MDCNQTVLKITNKEIIMKKTLISFLILSGIVSADINIDLQNTSGIFTIDGSAYLDQAFVQLVWNSTYVGNSISVDNTLLMLGDVVLSSFTTTPGYAGTWSDLGSQGGIFSDADVGTDILSGYLTIRVFDNANKGTGGLGFIFDVDVDGTLTAYDPFSTSSIYRILNLAGGSFGSLVAGNVGVVDVVPEPGTILLFALGGFGTYLVRRNRILAAKAAEEEQA